MLSFYSLPDEIIENNFIFTISMWEVHMLSQVCNKFKLLCEKYHHYKVFLNYIRPKSIVIGYCTLINTKKGILQIYEGEKHLLKFDIDDYSVVSLSCDQYRAFIILNDSKNNENYVYILAIGMPQKPVKLDLSSSDSFPKRKECNLSLESSDSFPKGKECKLDISSLRKFGTPVRAYPITFDKKCLIKFDKGLFEFDYEKCTTKFDDGILKFDYHNNQELKIVKLEDDSVIFSIFDYFRNLFIHTSSGYYIYAANNYRILPATFNIHNIFLDHGTILNIDIDDSRPIILTKNTVFIQNLATFGIQPSDRIVPMSFIYKDIACSDICKLPFKILSVHCIDEMNVILTSIGIFVLGIDSRFLSHKVRDRERTIEIKHPTLININGSLKNDCDIKNIFRGNHDLIFVTENGNIYGHGNKNCLGKNMPYLETKKIFLRETKSIPEMGFTCTRKEYKFWFGKGSPKADELRKILRERGLVIIKSSTRVYDMKSMCEKYIVD